MTTEILTDYYKRAFVRRMVDDIETTKRAKELIASGERTDLLVLPHGEVLDFGLLRRQVAEFRQQTEGLFND